MSPAIVSTGAIVLSVSAAVLSRADETVPRTSAKATRYHVLPDREQQIYFTSDAPLETITGQCNQVTGYVIAGPESNRGALREGLWRLPVNSLRTGVPLRDEHLQSNDWLDEQSCPQIVFELERVERLSEVRVDDGFQTYSGTLVGSMTIHGITRPIRIPQARYSFLPSSPRTDPIAKGDLLAIRAKYSIRLSDYGVSHSVLGSKVAQAIEIDTRLLMSTIPPDQQSEARPPTSTNRKEPAITKTVLVDSFLP